MINFWIEKRNLSWLRLAGLLVVISFLFSSLSAPFVQASLWQERRKAVENLKSSQTTHSSTNEPIQLASAMGLTPFQSNSLFPLSQTQIPANTISQVLEKVRQRSHVNAISHSKNKFQGIPSELVNKLEPYGKIERVHIAKGQALQLKEGQIRVEVSGKKSNAEAIRSNVLSLPLVIHIQDAHDIYSVQKNIALMIKELTGLGAGIVGVEGAEGKIEGIERWGRTGTKESMMGVAGYLLKEGLLTGVEVAGLYSRLRERESSLKRVEFYGIEEQKKYQEQVKAFKETLKNNKEVESWIKEVGEKISNLKKSFYSEELRSLDTKKEGYEKGEIKLGDWVQSLWENGSYPLHYPNLYKYLKAYEIEKKMNFKQVEQEQKKLLEGLSNSLSKQELMELLEESLAYRLGAIGYGEFYGHLRRRCEKAGIILTPEIKNYIGYLLLVEGIDQENLFKELKGLENKVFNSQFIAQGSEQKLYEIVEDYRLLVKAVDFRLSPEEWEEYRKREKEVARIEERIKELVSKETESPMFETSNEKENRFVSGSSSKEFSKNKLQVARELLKNVSKFNELSHERNHIFVKKLLEKIGYTKLKKGDEKNSDYILDSRSQSRFSVLVAGGYHSEGLEQELKAKGISYITIRPFMNTEEAKGNYHPLQSFKRDLLPLEKMFLPERVTLAPELATVNINSIKGQAAQGILKAGPVALDELEGNGNLKALLRKEKWIKVGKIFTGVVDGIRVAVSKDEKIEKLKQELEEEGFDAEDFEYGTENPVIVDIDSRRKKRAFAIKREDLSVLQRAGLLIQPLRQKSQRARRLIFARVPKVMIRSSYILKRAVNAPITVLASHSENDSTDLGKGQTHDSTAEGSGVEGGQGQDSTDQGVRIEETQTSAGSGQIGADPASSKGAESNKSSYTPLTLTAYHAFHKAYRNSLKYKMRKRFGKEKFYFKPLEHALLHIFDRLITAIGTTNSLVESTHSITYLMIDRAHFFICKYIYQELNNIPENHPQVDFYIKQIVNRLRSEERVTVLMSSWEKEITNGQRTLTSEEKAYFAQLEPLLNALSQSYAETIDQKMEGVRSYGKKLHGKLGKTLSGRELRNELNVTPSELVKEAVFSLKVEFWFATDFLRKRLELVQYHSSVQPGNTTKVLKSFNAQAWNPVCCEIDRRNIKGKLTLDSYLKFHDRLEEELSLRLSQEFKSDKKDMEAAHLKAMMDSFERAVNRLRNNHQTTRLEILPQPTTLGRLINSQMDSDQINNLVYSANEAAAISITGYLLDRVADSIYIEGQSVQKAVEDALLEMRGPDFLQKLKEYAKEEVFAGTLADDPFIDALDDLYNLYIRYFSERAFAQSSMDFTIELWVWHNYIQERALFLRAHPKTKGDLSSINIILENFDAREWQSKKREDNKSFLNSLAVGVVLGFFALVAAHFGIPKMGNLPETLAFFLVGGFHLTQAFMILIAAIRAGLNKGPTDEGKLIPEFRSLPQEQKSLLSQESIHNLFFTIKKIYRDFFIPCQVRDGKIYLNSRLMQFIPKGMQRVFYKHELNNLAFEKAHPELSKIPGVEESFVSLKDFLSLIVPLRKNKKLSPLRMLAQGMMSPLFFMGVVGMGGAVAGGKREGKSQKEFINKLNDIIVAIEAYKRLLEKGEAESFENQKEFILLELPSDLAKDAFFQLAREIQLIEPYTIPLIKEVIKFILDHFEGYSPDSVKDKKFQSELDQMRRLRNKERERIALQSDRIQVRTDLSPKLEMLMREGGIDSNTIRLLKTALPSGLMSLSLLLDTYYTVLTAEGAVQIFVQENPPSAGYIRGNFGAELERMVGNYVNALKKVIEFSDRADSNPQAHAFSDLLAKISADFSYQTQLAGKWGNQPLPHSSSPKLYLELGPGTKFLFHMKTELKDSMRYHLVDNTFFVVAHLKKLVELFGRKNVEVIRKNVFELEYEKGSVGTIHGTNLANFLDHNIEWWKKACGWLDQGGQLIFTSDPKDIPREKHALFLSKLYHELVEKEGWSFEYTIGEVHGDTSFDKLDRFTFTKPSEGKRLEPTHSLTAYLRDMIPRVSKGSQRVFEREIYISQRNSLPLSSVGKVLWLFEHHSIEADLKFINEIETVAPQYLNVITVLEHAPPGLYALRSTFPLLGNSIKELKDLEDPFLRDQLEQYLQDGWWPSDRALGNMPLQVVQDKSQHLAEVIEYLYGRPQINALFEQVPLESVISLIRSTLYLEKANHALYIGRKQDKFLENITAHFQEWIRSTELRDQALAKIIKDAMDQNPNSLIVIKRGVGHSPIVDMVGDYGNFEKEVRSTSFADFSPDAWIEREYGQMISQGELLPQSAWKTLLATFPHQAILRLFQYRDFEASQMLDQLFEEIEEEKLKELTREIQENSSILFRTKRDSSGVVKPDMRDVSLSIFILAWLQEAGLLPQELLTKFPPQAQEGISLGTSLWIDMLQGASFVQEAEKPEGAPNLLMDDGGSASEINPVSSLPSYIAGGISLGVGIVALIAHGWIAQKFGPLPNLILIALSILPLSLNKRFSTKHYRWLPLPLEAAVKAIFVVPSFAGFILMMDQATKISKARVKANKVRDGPESDKPSKAELNHLKRSLEDLFKEEGFKATLVDEGREAREIAYVNRDDPEEVKARKIHIDLLAFYYLPAYLRETILKDHEHRHLYDLNSSIKEPKHSHSGLIEFNAYLNQIVRSWQLFKKYSKETRLWRFLAVTGTILVFVATLFAAPIIQRVANPFSSISNLKSLMETSKIDRFSTKIAETKMSIDEWVDQELAKTDKKLLIFGEDHNSLRTKRIFRSKILPKLKGLGVNFIVLELLPIDAQPLFAQFNQTGKLDPAIRDLFKLGAKVQKFPEDEWVELLYDIHENGIQVIAGGIPITKVIESMRVWDSDPDPKYRNSLLQLQREVLIQQINNLRQIYPNETLAVYSGGLHNDRVREEVPSFVEPAFTVDIMDPYKFNPGGTHFNNRQELEFTGHWRYAYQMGAVLQIYNRQALQEDFAAQIPYPELADWIIYLGENPAALKPLPSSTPIIIQMQPITPSQQATIPPPAETVAPTSSPIQTVSPQPSSKSSLSTKAPAQRIVWFFERHSQESSRKLAKKMEDDLLSKDREIYLFVEQGTPMLGDITAYFLRRGILLDSEESLKDPRVRDALESYLKERVWTAIPEIIVDFRSGKKRVEEIVSDPRDPRLPLWKYLAEHPKIQIFSEQAPLEAFLAQLRSDFALDRALIALYENGDEKKFFKEMTTYYQQAFLSKKLRDEAIEKLLQENISNHPHAAVFINIGSGHSNLIKNISVNAGVKTEKFLPTIDNKEPYDIINERYGKAILSGKQVPVKARKLLLANLPLSVLIKYVSSPDLGGLKLITELVLEKMKERDLAQLAKDIQKNAPLLKKGGGYPFVWNQYTTVFILLWLRDHNFLPVELQNKLLPSYRTVLSDSENLQYFLKVLKTKFQQSSSIFWQASALAEKADLFFTQSASVITQVSMAARDYFFGLPAEAAEKKGKIIWNFEVHHSKSQHQIISDLEQALKYYKEVYLFMENAPPLLSMLPSFAPELAYKIKSPQSLNDPMIRKEMQAFLNQYWSKLFEMSLEATKQGKVPNPNIADLMNYLAKHPQIKIVAEQPTLESMIAGINFQFGYEKALDLLYVRGDEKGFFIEMLNASKSFLSAMENRDRAYGKKIEDTIQKHPGAGMVVQRGLSHKGILNKIKNIGRMNNMVKIEDKRGESGKYSWQGKITKYENEILKGKSLPPSFRKYMLSIFPYMAVLEILADPTVETLLNLDKMIMKLSINDLELLTLAIQNESIYYERQVGKSKGRALYVVAWLKNHKFLTPEIESKLHPRVRQILPTLKTSDKGNLEDSAIKAALDSANDAKKHSYQKNPTTSSSGYLGKIAGALSIGLLSGCQQVAGALSTSVPTTIQGGVPWAAPLFFTVVIVLGVLSGVVSFLIMAKIRGSDTSSVESLQFKIHDSLRKSFVLLDRIFYFISILSAYGIQALKIFLILTGALFLPMTLIILGLTKSIFPQGENNILANWGLAGVGLALLILVTTGLMSSVLKPLKQHIHFKRTWDKDPKKVHAILLKQNYEVLGLLYKLDTIKWLAKDHSEGGREILLDLLTWEKDKAVVKFTVRQLQKTGTENNAIISSLLKRLADDNLIMRQNALKELSSLEVTQDQLAQGYLDALEVPARYSSYDIHHRNYRSRMWDIISRLSKLTALSPEMRNRVLDRLFSLVETDSHNKLAIYPVGKEDSDPIIHSNIISLHNVASKAIIALNGTELEERLIELAKPMIKAVMAEPPKPPQKDESIFRRNETTNKMALLQRRLPAIAEIFGHIRSTRAVPDLINALSLFINDPVYELDFVHEDWTLRTAKALIKIEDKNAIPVLLDYLDTFKYLDFHGIYDFSMPLAIVNFVSKDPSDDVLKRLLERFYKLRPSYVRYKSSELVADEYGGHHEAFGEVKERNFEYFVIQRILLEHGRLNPTFSEIIWRFIKKLFIPAGSLFLFIALIHSGSGWAYTGKSLAQVAETLNPWAIGGIVWAVIAVVFLWDTFRTIKKTGSNIGAYGEPHLSGAIFMILFLGGIINGIVWNMVGRPYEGLVYLSLMAISAVILIVTMIEIYLKKISGYYNRRWTEISIVDKNRVRKIIYKNPNPSLPSEAPSNSKNSNSIEKTLRDEKGQSQVEYGIILGGLAGVIVFVSKVVSGYPGMGEMILATLLLLGGVGVIVYGAIRPILQLKDEQNNSNRLKEMEKIEERFKRLRGYLNADETVKAEQEIKEIERLKRNYLFKARVSLSGSIKRDGLMSMRTGFKGKRNESSGLAATSARNKKALNLLAMGLALALVTNPTPAQSKAVEDQMRSIVRNEVSVNLPVEPILSSSIGEQTQDYWTGGLEVSDKIKMSQEEINEFEETAWRIAVLAKWAGSKAEYKETSSLSSIGEDLPGATKTFDGTALFSNGVGKQMVEGSILNELRRGGEEKIALTAAYGVSKGKMRRAVEKLIEKELDKDLVQSAKDRMVYLSASKGKRVILGLVVKELKGLGLGELGVQIVTDDPLRLEESLQFNIRVKIYKLMSATMAIEFKTLRDVAEEMKEFRLIHINA